MCVWKNVGDCMCEHECECVCGVAPYISHDVEINIHYGTRCAYWWGWELWTWEGYRLHVLVRGQEYS